MKKLMSLGVALILALAAVPAMAKGFTPGNYHRPDRMGQLFWTTLRMDEPFDAQNGSHGWTGDAFMQQLMDDTWPEPGNDPGGGGQYNIAYNTGQVKQVNVLYVRQNMAVRPVPEPSSILLLGTISLVGLAVVGRKKLVKS